MCGACRFGGSSYDEINIASIPEQRDWNGALRGVLYRRV